VAEVLGVEEVSYLWVVVVGPVAAFLEGVDLVEGDLDQMEEVVLVEVDLSSLVEVDPYQEVEVHGVVPFLEVVVHIREEVDQVVVAFQEVVEVVEAFPLEGAVAWTSVLTW
jgi:hypothetical protein